MNPGTIIAICLGVPMAFVILFWVVPALVGFWMRSWENRYQVQEPRITGITGHRMHDDCQGAYEPDVRDPAPSGYKWDDLVRFWNGRG